MKCFVRAFGRICIALVPLFGVQFSQAAGFYLTELGTPASLGTAGVANPTNTFSADTSWTNPAAMTYLEDEQIMAGLQVILPKIEFSLESAGTSGDDGGNAGEIAPVPSFFYVRPLSDQWRFGFSVAGTMGGGYNYGDNFAGRYAVKEVELGALSMTPSLGYRVNDKLSVGAGMSVIYTSMYQEIAINNPGPLADGNAVFDDLDDFGFQGILSMTYEISDRVLLGVVYRSELDTELEGDLKLRNVAGLGNRNGDLSIDWTSPQWLDIGLRYKVSDNTLLFLNAGWQEWSVFSKNYITVDTAGPTLTPVLNRNWDDTWYAGIAVAHQLDDHSMFSLGMSYDSSPVDDEDRTLDLALDETWKFSGSYGWMADKFDFSLGATLYVMGDSSVDQTSQGVRVVGDYDTNAMLFLGGTLRYKF